MRARFQSRGAVCALLAISWLALPATATAQQAPARPSVITNPSWSRQPAPEFPAGALSTGVTQGSVTLRCITTASGVLIDCEVIEETPAAQGFAASALAGAARARLAPRTVNGAAPGARVQFTIRYASPAMDVLLEPTWAVPPRPVMPRSARPARIHAAQVQLDCEIVPEFGRMRNCRVIQDGPQGHGFGEAAIQAVRGAAISPEWLRRAGPNTHAIVTIHFQR
jgi:TonB family protein